MRIRELRPGEATTQRAEQLGLLMADLDDRHDGGIIDMERFEGAVNSPSAGWIIAELEPRDSTPHSLHTRRLPIIGSATLSTLHGCMGEADAAWLSDFVVAEEWRGKRDGGISVAQGIWNAMTHWRQERGLWALRFTSSETREQAHKFYIKQGCTVDTGERTAYFQHVIDSSSH